MARCSTLGSVGVAALLALAACGGEAPSGAAAEESGPLVVAVGVGGSGLYPPARRLWSRDTWHGSFGGFVLCTSGGARVRLVDVRFRTDVPSDRVRVFVRSVPPRAGGSSSAYIPVGSALGSPPDFAEPYVTQRVGGSFSTDLAGVVVDRPCRTPEARAETGFQEVFLSLEAGADGARIDSFDLVYEYGGDQHTVPVEWAMVLCGSRIDAKTCPRTSESENGG